MTADVRIATCNLCEAMCGMQVAVEDNRITSIRGNPDDVFSRGHICPKGPSLREMVDDPDRLRTPVRRTPTGWQPIGWDEALDEIASRLKGIQRQHGKNAVALYIGNPTVHSHRSSLGSQVLELAIGTQNRFDPNSQDSNPRLFACMQVYGDGLAMSVPDLDRTELLVMLGANPAASNGSQMSAGNIRERLKGIRERGGRIVLLDPRRTESAAWVDTHHFIRPGGDAALLLAMLHVVFAENLEDKALFRRAAGIRELRAVAERFPPSRIAPAIGMDPGAIADLARQVATTKRAVVYGRVGLCQNEFGPVASWLVEVFNVVTGHWDVEGGAMYPTPAIDVGPLARLLVGNNYGRWKSRVRRLPEFLGSLPSAVMAEEMETPGEDQIRALVCFAGNPVLSTPNGERLSRALSQLEYVVGIDLYVNETTRHANIVLPATYTLESGNYDILLAGLAVRNIAKYSAPVIAPPVGVRDDWETTCELAMRMKLPAWEWLRRQGRRLTRKLPELVLDLFLRFGQHKLTLKQLRETPHGIDLGPLLPGSLKVRTRDGYVRLAPEVFVADIPRLERWVDAQAASENQLVLIGRRSLRSNNSWMHNVRSLTKGPDRAQLLMHPDDGARLGLSDGSRVHVRSRAGTAAARLALTSDIMPGVVSLPHGFGHASAADTLHIAGPLPGPNVNAVTDEQFVEPIIGTSILNGVPVSVEAVSES